MTSELIIYHAKKVFGEHPMDWPTPPRQRPRWWQRRARRELRKLESVFNYTSQEALDRFYAQSRAGQSVYEDCGGYLLRCYRAMLGLPIEEPYTYQQAIAFLTRRAKEPRP